jgi:hypothetical protein
MTSEFRIVEHRDGWIIALYVGDKTKPKFSADDPDWRFLSHELPKGRFGLHQPVHGTVFDSREEATAYFGENEAELRAKAPKRTIGP